MKNTVAVTVTSLLSILLLTIHLADDIVRGFEKGNVANLSATPVVVLWLYAALFLNERRSGLVIILVLSLLSFGMPFIHMSGRGVGAGSRIANTSGALLFVWTLIALNVTALLSAVLAARGLWSLRRGQPS